LNHEGGTILVGVKESSNTVEGFILKRKDRDNIQLAIDNAIKNFLPHV